MGTDTETGKRPNDVGAADVDADVRSLSKARSNKLYGHVIDIVHLCDSMRMSDPDGEYQIGILGGGIIVRPKRCGALPVDLLDSEVKQKQVRWGVARDRVVALITEQLQGIKTS